MRLLAIVLATLVSKTVALNGPRLIAPAVVYKSEHLYVFGGMPSSETSPVYTMYDFDLVTLEWSIKTPTGEDRPLGRMWHSMAESTDGTQLIVYGGIIAMRPLYWRCKRSVGALMSSAPT